MRFETPPTFAALFLGLILASCGSGTSEDGPAAAPTPAYQGAAVCAECHAAEAEAWRGSHHDLAMQAATKQTVLGDFDNAEFEHRGSISRFTTRASTQGDEFLIESRDADGVTSEFKVAYTFGADPLQQYLVDTGSGKLQSFTVAWDTERKAWYSLYPDQSFEPGDPLHWTGIYQNWNGMCADCHSTKLVKAFDEENDRFDTHYEELDVACEACHGPGEDHVQWARAGGTAGEEELANGLSVHHRRDWQAPQINSCAPCHSRRTLMKPDVRSTDNFLDVYQLELLRANSYHPDGQILGEVYVYGSFAQSKMHASGVTCTDCHNPHSLELHFPGNALCAQCHSTNAPVERFPNLPKIDYDKPEHHHHEPGSPGASCVECHMTAKTYMGIDARRDHSFRIPRPDMTVPLGTPNACDNCHAEKGAEWAAERVEEWFGPERPYHFGAAFAAGRAGDPAAVEHLIGLSRDRAAPAIVRATALELMQATGKLGLDLSRSLLGDSNPMIRATAIRGLESMKPVERLDPLLPLIDDESLIVRIEAARMLAGAPTEVLDAVSDNYDKTLAEWRASQLLSAEMPWAHHNLGSLEQDLGNLNEARDQYKRAIEIDPYSLPSTFNLATLYNKTGRNLEAERVLRDAIELVPNEGELHYSLGLLLAEVGRLEDAANSLIQAAERMPWRPRVHYNAGLALQRAGRMDEAERFLIESNRLQADVPEVVHAIALYYVELKLWTLALPFAERLVELVPDAEWVGELVDEIREGIESDT